MIESSCLVYVMVVVIALAMVVAIAVSMALVIAVASAVVVFFVFVVTEMAVNSHLLKNNSSTCFLHYLIKFQIEFFAFFFSNFEQDF